MQKISLKSTLISGSGMLVIVGSGLAMTASAYAIANASSAPASGSSDSSSRLDAAKLKLCSAREKTIDNVLTRVSNRGNGHLTLITDVANKTEAFYTRSGKSLSNYESLLATVNADKVTAQDAVNRVKTDSISFSCDGSNPVGILQAFKADVQNEVSSLKDYKTAVQALITGVKSVQTTSTDGGN